MRLSEKILKSVGLAGGFKSLLGNVDEPKKKDPILGEMKTSLSKKLLFDNKSVYDIVGAASKKTGVSRSLLFSSAFQEGMNKAVFKPELVSEAYTNAEASGLDTKTYPVDGFFNYGLDRFGEGYDRYKKYLPEGFDKRFKTYKAKNEKGGDVTTAAFMTNEDALIAKGAVLRDIIYQVDDYAKKKNIPLDNKARDYFTLAAYNGGLGNATIMMDEFSQSKDKSKFIDEGLSTRTAVHKNVLPRLARMSSADEMFKEEDDKLLKMNAGVQPPVNILKTK
jgi:hypothetical protein